MPIRAKPSVYICPACGWRKVVSPKSDALLPGEYYQSCPKCGFKSLKKEEFNPLVEFGGRLLSKFFGAQQERGYKALLFFQLSGVSPVSSTLGSHDIEIFGEKHD